MDASVQCPYNSVPENRNKYNYRSGYKYLDYRIVRDLVIPNGKIYTRTIIKNKFRKESLFLNSGLMGKAEIFFRKGSH
jgi:hypothetical protein